MSGIKQSPLLAAAIAALLAVFSLVSSICAISSGDFPQYYVDRTRSRSWGVGYGDVNGDGLNDIVSGKYLYINKGLGLSKAESNWEKIELPSALGDAEEMIDSDGDGKYEIIGIAAPSVVLAWPADNTYKTWKTRTVGTGIVKDHGSSEGQFTIDIIPGGHEDLLVSDNANSIHLFVPSPNPFSSTWAQYKVTEDGCNEEIVAIDMDGDKLRDVVAGGGGKAQVKWWKNPGKAQGNWQGYQVNSVACKIDRINGADLDNDNDIDIYTVEERCEASNVKWFENPGNPTQGNWKQHIIGAAGGQGHSGDAGDLDCDGDIDLVSGSTTGSKECVIWENNGKGSFTRIKLNGSGDLHNASDIVDLDGDGDLDICGIGWFDPTMRLWENKTNVSGPKCKPVDAMSDPVQAAEPVQPHTMRRAINVSSVPITTIDQLSEFINSASDKGARITLRNLAGKRIVAADGAEIRNHAGTGVFFISITIMGHETIRKAVIARKQ